MKRVTAFMGIAGLFLAGVGMVDFLLEGNLSDLSKAHFLIGLVGIIAFLITHARDIFRTLRSRTTRYGALVSAYVLVVLAILVVLNTIGAITSAQLTDLTENSLYTLAPQTLKVLDNLQDTLTMHAFFNGGRAGLEAVRPLDRLIRTYVSASRKVKLDIVNPVSDPATAEKYRVVQDATLILEYKTHTLKVNTISEESVTNTIIRLLDDRQKMACFTIGHGEPDITGETAGLLQGFGNLKELLTRKDYQVQEVDLVGKSEVPPECTVTLVACPRTPLSEGELMILDQYLQAGGRVLVAIDAGVESGLEPLLARWGVMVGNNVVVEKVVEGLVTQLRGFQPTTMKPSLSLTVTEYNKSYPITLDLSHIRPTQYFAARTITPLQTATPELKVIQLIWSKKDSWIETDVENATTRGLAMLEPQKGDKPGPACLGVAASLTTQAAMEPLHGLTRQSRLVVVGNAQWLTNRMFRETRNFNPDLLLNMVGWLAGLEQYLAIGPRSAPAKHINLNPDQKQLVFNVTVIFIPELLLLIGAFVWWVRR